MSTVSKTSRWLPRLFALLAGALVAASATFWALRLSAPRAPWVQAPAGDTAPEALPVEAAQLSALLGAGGGGDKAVSASAAPAAPALASRFVITGVVASPSSQGVALIAVDGQPAKPYRVGAVIVEGVMLQSVAPRKAVLAASRKGPALLTLELPAATSGVAATAPPSTLSIVPSVATPPVAVAPAVVTPAVMPAAPPKPAGAP